jgi:hypothetical protein
MNKEINQHKYDGFPDDNKDSHFIIIGEAIIFMLIYFFIHIASK